MERAIGETEAHARPEAPVLGAESEQREALKKVEAALWRFLADNSGFSKDDLEQVKGEVTESLAAEGGDPTQKAEEACLAWKKTSPEGRRQDARERIERWLGGNGKPQSVGRRGSKEQVAPPSPGKLRADFDDVCDKAEKEWRKGKASPELCAARAFTAWGGLARVKSTTHGDDLDVDTFKGAIVTRTLTAEARLQIETAAWLKKKYSKIRGI